MLGQKHCVICSEPASGSCLHLALAAEARDFVRRCVEQSQAQREWQMLCQNRSRAARGASPWTSESEDFTWLETAFCNQFLKHLRWFQGIDYEWRTTNRVERGGFWVLLWSREPRHLWWELRDEIERQAHASIPMAATVTASGPWLFPPAR